jgi:hypothetical protein
MDKRYTIAQPAYYTVRGRRYDLSEVPVGATFIVADRRSIDSDGDLLGHVEGDEWTVHHIARECLRRQKTKTPKVSEAAVLKSLDANLTIDDETAQRVLRVARLIDGK